MFRILLCLFLIIDWCGLFSAMVCVILVCLHAYILLLLPAIDSNENECIEEGGIFEYRKKKTRDRPTKASHLYLIHI
jgi:hypothetical protein